MNAIINYVVLAVPYVALLLTIAALLWIYSLSSNHKRIVRKVRELSNTLSLNIPAFTAPRNEVSSIQIAEIERKIAELKESIAKLARAKDNEKPTPEPLPVAPIEQAPEAESDITYYAKFPDTDEGFTDKWLIQQQNGEQIYELILTPDQGCGTFYISEQPDVQRYALSDVNYYLLKGCTFLNQPGKSSSIDLVEAGTLTRSGDVWVIEEKAKIQFV